ncbi:hypothetical protein B0T16DRAFT_421675 [Cercophora newfieldiana]|uniref:Uncharacterized protein n=1 Tax=Cercophora newfieldiana TaxID=92897 RepID=A0AA39XS42_9PEZI|nr:hypothetical protein B0T16DRAFT_421675 [Cercophora newfieldiana]
MGPHPLLRALPPLQKGRSKADYGQLCDRGKIKAYDQGAGGREHSSEIRGERGRRDQALTTGRRQPNCLNRLQNNYVEERGEY